MDAETIGTISRRLAAVCSGGRRLTYWPDAPGAYRDLLAAVNVPGVTVVDAAHSVDKLRPRNGFGHIPPGTGTNNRNDVFSSVRHAQRQKRRRRIDALDHGLSSTIRHVHVKKHNIGMCCANTRDSFRDTTRLTNNVDGLRQFRTYTGPKNRVVIDKEDREHTFHANVSHPLMNPASCAV